MSISWVELVGYLASALVVASLAMTSVVRLRIVSLIGSVVFVAYGLMLGSIPIVITNAAVAGLNVWFLRKEFAPDRDLERGRTGTGGTHHRQSPAACERVRVPDNVACCRHSR